MTIAGWNAHAEVVPIPSESIHHGHSLTPTYRNNLTVISLLCTGCARILKLFTGIRNRSPRKVMSDCAFLQGRSPSSADIAISSRTGGRKRKTMPNFIRSAGTPQNFSGGFNCLQAILPCRALRVLRPNGALCSFAKVHKQGVLAARPEEKRIS